MHDDPIVAHAHLKDFFTWIKYKDQKQNTQLCPAFCKAFWTIELGCLYPIIHYSTCVPANGSAERIRHLRPHQVAIYLHWIRPTCTTLWISARAKAHRWFNKHDYFQSTQLVWHLCNVGNFDVSKLNKRISFIRFRLVKNY